MRAMSVLARLPFWRTSDRTGRSLDCLSPRLVSRSGLPDNAANVGGLSIIIHTDLLIDSVSGLVFPRLRGVRREEFPGAAAAGLSGVWSTWEVRMGKFRFLNV